MPLLLLLRLSFGLFARFCVLHIHIPFLHLCFCLFVFLYLSTPSLSSSSPSFFAHSLLHAICLSRLRIAHCYFYLNYLKIYPNTNTLTLYHIPLHQASTPVMSIALFYNTRTEHEQTEQLSESCVCVSEYMYYRRSNSSAASFGGSCDVFAIIVLFSHSFSMYFGAALLATVAPPPPPCKCRYLCCCSTSYALML